MTTLLIQTESLPLTVNLPMQIEMTTAEFYEFCQANRDLRIERSANGEVIIMPPAFSDTGTATSKLFNSLLIGLMKMVRGKCLILVQDLPYPMAQLDRPMQPGFGRNAGMVWQRRRRPLLPRFVRTL